MADSKLTDLPETTSPALTDDVYVVTTPGGTPASKRSTIANLRAAMGFGALSAPTALANWSADNVGSYFVTTEANGTIQFACSVESGDRIRGYHRSYPSPVKVTAAFTLGMQDSGYNQIGIYISDGTKFKIFGVDGLGVPHWTYFSVWNNWSGESTNGNIRSYVSPLIWMQYEEDSTNRYFRMSPNGVYWITHLSEDKTTSLTGTVVGFGAYTAVAGPNSSPAAIGTLLHWVEG